MIEYKSGERLGFIKKAHTRKSVLVQYLKNRSQKDNLKQQRNETNKIHINHK